MAKTKHGGVLIAVKDELNHSRCKINVAHDDFICVIIDLAGTVLQISCIYNPPTGSLNRWKVDDLFVLLSELNVNETTIGAQETIIAGDLSLLGCDWANQTSTNTCEQSLMDKLSENCFVNFLQPPDSKLDVMMTNKPELFLKNSVDRRLTKAYQINDKNCLDHSAIGANLNNRKKIFQEIDYVKFTEDILSTPFHRAVSAI